MDTTPVPPRHPGTAGEVLAVFGRLGLTSFGGPVAHLGYFRTAFVTRRGWLSDRAFADLVAFCQFLPGPASSQVGMAVGWQRAGVLGLLAAWAGFTLPSALLMLAFAYGVGAAGDLTGAGWIVGLKAAAVAVVAQAVLGMARTLASTRATATVAGGAVVVLLLAPAAGVPLPLVQVGVIVAAGAAGLRWVTPSSDTVDDDRLAAPARTRTAVTCLAVFGLLLAGLPVLAALTDGGAAAFADTFYRAGSLVFGGGHVVLPLLQAETAGTVTHDQFLAGYGAAQALPGPLFTFSAYLGALSTAGPGGALGAAIALVAVFLPSALLVTGALPFWDRLRRAHGARRALAGVNAGVVGLLAAAFYDPVFTQGVLAAPSPPSALALALAAYVALTTWKAPPWAVVIASATLGALAL
ncbi:chromate efflux transporter [Myceligenerans indicum]|uniref:Chromate efflux transporter n=1 Tax=Myceligenerans indicum TaxID=2593663 RepID=A0ABS1LPW7_9MICO|nr:chromate efflux transporter [Myceligenerans indicum]MBL0888352.1 chromate efflux transporter [Myceligenerans indicum]